MARRKRSGPKKTHSIEKIIMNELVANIRIVLKEELGLDAGPGLKYFGFNTIVLKSLLTIGKETYTGAQVHKALMDDGKFKDEIYQCLMKFKPTLQCMPPNSGAWRETKASIENYLDDIVSDPDHNTRVPEYVEEVYAKYKSETDATLNDLWVTNDPEEFKFYRKCALLIAGDLNGGPNDDCPIIDFNKGSNRGTSFINSNRPYMQLSVSAWVSLQALPDDPASFTVDEKLSFISLSKGRGIQLRPVSVMEHAKIVKGHYGNFVRRYDKINASDLMGYIFHNKTSKHVNKAHRFKFVVGDKLFWPHELYDIIKDGNIDATVNMAYEILDRNSI